MDFRRAISIRPITSAPKAHWRVMPTLSSRSTQHSSAADSTSCDRCAGTSPLAPWAAGTGRRLGASATTRSVSAAVVQAPPPLRFSSAHARLLDVPGGALAARRDRAPAHALIGPLRIPRHHRAIRPGAGGIERNHQRRGGVMHRADCSRVMLVMDVTIEHRGLEWLEQLERLVAVRRPPAPRPVELEQWTMG